MAKSIGIKLFNGKFLPILKNGEIKTKRVILTTVRDNQEKTIIELYEGESEKCLNNEYLGKLTISINRETKKGSPAIELHIRHDENGILYAKAWDLDSGEENEIQIEHSYTKTILRETLAGKKAKNTDEIATQIKGYSDYNDYDRSERFKKILLAIAVFIIVALLSLGVFLGIKKIIAIIMDKASKKENTKTEKIIEKEEIKKDIVEEKKETQVEKTMETRKEENEIIGLKKLDGEKHYVRWGDNLWNICKKYYDDPWYYPALAEANPNISNPRLIYAGTYIIIPPKSSLKRWTFE